MQTRYYMRYAIFFTITAVVLYIVYSLWSLFLPFLVAYILLFILKPAVSFLESRDFGHTVSVISVFVSFFAVIGLFLYLFVPAFISEVISIQRYLPVYRDALIDKINHLEVLLSTQVPGMSAILKAGEFNLRDSVTSLVMESLVDMFTNLPAVLFNLFPIVINIIVIPFATFFFLKDGTAIRKSIVSLVPNRMFETSLDLMHSLNQQAGWLLRGMLVTSVLMSVFISLLLWMVGLPYPIVVGVFSGLANLIPYAGPVVGVIAASLVALMTSSPDTIYLYIVLVFIVANLVENILVQPLVLAKAANLHPLLVIFLILFGSKVAGVFGMLFAVPVASLLQVTMRIIFRTLSRPIRKDIHEYKIVGDLTGECPQSS